MRLNIKYVSALLIALFMMVFALGTSCQSVKLYQRSYLNDASMQMGGSKLSGNDNYAQTIREGASGGGGKSSGGCGCN